MKHSIDLIDLIEQTKDCDTRELVQTVVSTLRANQSKVIQVDKIQLGLLIRCLGEGYASKRKELNWIFLVYQGENRVILSTPIQN